MTREDWGDIHVMLFHLSDNTLDKIDEALNEAFHKYWNPYQRIAIDESMRKFKVDCTCTNTHEHARTRTNTHEHARTRTNTHEHARTRTNTHEHARTRTNTHEHARTHLYLLGSVEMQGIHQKQTDEVGSQVPCR